MHAIKSQQRQIAQKDRGKISLSLLFSLSLSFSPGRGGRSRVFVVKPGSNAASTWSQVACRGYRARTSPSPGGTCTFRVHPPLLPSTFFPAPHTPSPVPFRHNNHAVSQRVFNGRRLHATGQSSPSSSSLHRFHPPVLSLSLVLFSSLSPSLHLSLSFPISPPSLASPSLSSRPLPASLPSVSSSFCLFLSLASAAMPVRHSRKDSRWSCPLRTRENFISPPESRRIALNGSMYVYRGFLYFLNNQFFDSQIMQEDAL